MPRPSVDEILQAHREGRTRDYTLNVTAQGVSLTADGPDDHARALEALGKIPEAMRSAVGLTSTVSLLPAEPTGPQTSLEGAGRDYFEVEQRSLRRNTKEARIRAFASFKRHFGGLASASTITRPMAADWAKALIQGGSSKATARNYVSHVAQIFDYLIQTGRLTENTVKGVVVMKLREKAARLASGHTWEPFDTFQLQEIYKPENLKRARTEHVRWSALIGLYSGARVGEVSQIYLRDFSSADGIDYVMITNTNEGQTLKTESSQRMVPIHPDLVRLGLMKRVETLRERGEQRLFPGVRLDGKAGPGNAVSKGFAHYLKIIGIHKRHPNGRVGFHSLRKNVVQALQGSRMSDDRRRALVGHEGEGVDVHITHYARKWRADELTAFFDGLTWGQWLDFPGLKEMLLTS